MLKSIIKMFPIYMYYFLFPPHKLLKLFFFFFKFTLFLNWKYILEHCMPFRLILTHFACFFSFLCRYYSLLCRRSALGPGGSRALMGWADGCRVAAGQGRLWNWLCSVYQLHNLPKSQYNSIGQTQFKINTLILILNKVRHAIVWWLICVPNYHDCMCKSSNYRSK